MDVKTEILYLAKGGKEDIFVEKCPKQQNVVDGIRFLYRQYVKKKPGVILNDCNSYNRRIQTVLFVSAIRPVLEHPVLILCLEGDESKWRDCFQIWTNMANDITTDTINPFAKKVSVYISPIHDITKFYSREWSGVIIDSDIMHKEILKININAKFRVWITGVDVKNDLTIFSQLYKWLYPKEKFDPNMFDYDVRNPTDVVNKAILLDSFMEDVVIRTNDQENTTVKSPDTPKVTRKNKDATGTKIKRTKRKNRISSSEDDSPTKTSKTNKTASNDNNLKYSTTTNANLSKIDPRKAIDNSRPSIDRTKAIIDDARRTIDSTRTTTDNSRVTIDGFRVSIDDTRATINDSRSTIGKRATIDNFRVSIDDSRSTIVGKIPTLDDSRSTIDETKAVYDVLSNKTVDSSKIRIEYFDEDQTNDQNKINELSEKSLMICDEDDNSMDLLLKYEVDEKYTPLGFKKINGDQKLEPSDLDQKPESYDSAYDKDTQENFDEMVKFNDPESCGSIKDATTSNDKYGIPLVPNEITSKDQIIQNNNEVENDIDLKPKVKESEDLFSTESMKTLNKITKQKQQNAMNSNKNEIGLKTKDLSKTKLQSEDLFSTESISNLNKIANQNDTFKKDLENKEAVPSSSLDAKIKQMEALAMKKFKGSLLDSIF